MKGQIVSLIPLGKVEGITTKGLKFPLNDETLEIGFREGASNAILQKQFSIEIKNGILLVFVNQAY
jgi:thiamine pyrophosphokinase